MQQHILHKGDRKPHEREVDAAGKVAPPRVRLGNVPLLRRHVRLKAVEVVLRLQVGIACHLSRNGIAYAFCREQTLTLALQRRAALSHGGGKLQLAGLQPPDLVEREAEIPQQRDAQQRLQILLAVVAVFILPPRGSEQPLLLVVADVRARQAAALFDLFDVHRLSFCALRRPFPML